MKTDIETEKSVWPFLIGVATLLIVIVICSAGLYHKGYNHGREYEMKRAVESGVAVERDDGSIQYLKRPQLQSMW